MTKKDSSEQEYMRENKETMQTPPQRKEGLEEPKKKGLKPVQLGIAIFVIIVLILIITGISSDMWGLMD